MYEFLSLASNKENQITSCKENFFFVLIYYLSCDSINDVHVDKYTNSVFNIEIYGTQTFNSSGNYKPVVITFFVLYINLNHHVYDENLHQSLTFQFFAKIIQQKNFGVKLHFSASLNAL